MTNLLVELIRLCVTLPFFLIREVRDEIKKTDIDLSMDKVTDGIKDVNKELRG